MEHFIKLLSLVSKIIVYVQISNIYNILVKCEKLTKKENIN